MQHKINVFVRISRHFWGLPLELIKTSGHKRISEGACFVAFSLYFAVSLIKFIQIFSLFIGVAHVSRKHHFLGHCKRKMLIKALPEVRPGKN
jgi:hypothetical protein